MLLHRIFKSARVRALPRISSCWPVQGPILSMLMDERGAGSPLLWLVARPDLPTAAPSSLRMKK
jgi:hypothetical protein